MLEKLFNLKDSVIRGIATTFLFKWLDNYKTEIARAVQAVNMILTGMFLLCVMVPPTFGFDACMVVDFLNLQWVLLGNVLGHLGLEFGIQDRKAKERLKEKGLLG